MSAILQRIRNPELLAQVEAAARRDGHSALGVSHAVLRDGEIIGGVSIVTIPLVHVWMDSKKSNMRDALAMLSQSEAVLRDRGAGYYVLPCQEQSPFYPLLPKVGFTDLGGNAHLFHRKLEG